MKTPNPVKNVVLFRALPGSAVLLCVLALLTGCAGSGEVRDAGANEAHQGEGASEARRSDGASDVISFYENRSVDRAVREDFDAALVLLRTRKYAEAIKLLQKVAQKSQNNSAPYVNIALAYEMTGEMGLAEDNLKRALAINPDHPVTMNEYALLYRRTGRFAEARKLYESLLVRYPSFLPARKNLGVLCELYLNDLRCALDQYEAYNRALPDDEEVKLWIIGAKQKSGG
ncbi:MAG: tetratricopeptide repeat protein [Gammaproteobacteria bacterium]|nr:tetratricopeptide repeat protein [Gammaproteobacteria bacterium]MBU1481526.1 tetratricopeptide repeat protein [Gammaproteobacteria bacterium]